MNKQDLILLKAQKIAAPHIERVNREMADVAHQMVQDQTEWIDKCMQDLMPPDIYDDDKALRNLEAVSAYVNRHGIRIIHIVDTHRIRIMVGERIYGEWKPVFTVDGEPIDFEKVGGMLDDGSAAQNN